MGGLSFETNEELLALFPVLFANFETKLAQSSPPIRLKTKTYYNLIAFSTCALRALVTVFVSSLFVCVSSAYIVIGVVLQQFV